MAQQVYVNASTSVVQIDSSQITTGAPAIVYLSSIYAPGTLITIRDIAGYASATKSIVVSTTEGLHFLDGTQVSSYSITQPYGFITVNPKTSTIWALMNTFAFPDQSAAALVNSINAVTGTTSTLYSYQALISTAAISSISTDTVFVRTNLSVGQSTIANDIYLRSTLTAIGGISTAATVFASTAVTTRSFIATSTLQTPFAQINFSTGLALDVAGSIRTASTISTLGPLYVGGLISTASDLAVGGSTLIAGQLRVGAYTLLQSSLSTVGSFSLGGIATLASTLTTKDNAMFQAHVSVASNVTVGGYLSVMSSTYLHGLLTVSSGFLLYGLFSTASSINVGQHMSIAGNLAVGGDVFFNDRLLDLDNLSVIHCLNVGNTISTLSSIAAGGSLQVAASTLLIGPVSTGSTLTVASHLSTVGNLAIGGSAYFASTLTVGGALCTLSNVAVGGTLRVSSTTLLAQGLSTVGQGAFFSSVQIQGGLSVFSSLAVSCNVDIQGILSAKGFNLGGAAVVTTLGITQNTGWGLNVSSSTLHYGHISTMGGIDMVGRFSTPNVIATGSTLFTSFATVSNNLSTLGNTNVGSALNVLGVTTLGGTTNAIGYARFTNGLSTITNTNVGGSLNVLGAATVGGVFTAVDTATFNTTTTTTGVATFNGAGGGGVGVIVTNNLTVNGGTINATSATANIGTISLGSGVAGFNEQQLGDLRAPGPVALGATTATSLNITKTLSTAWNSAFYSSVQIQGSLSVFSSVAIAGFLTAAGLSLSGAVTVSSFTTGLGASPGFTATLSTSTLSYGLFSTLGSMNVGGALTVGSNINVLGTGITAASVTGSNTLFTNAVTASNTVVTNALTASNTVATNSVTGSNSVLTNAINSSNSITIATGSLTPTSGYILDVAGAFRTTGNHLVVNTSPKLTLSNTNTNAYSIYTNPAANAGSFVITKNNNSDTAILIAPSGNVGINTNAPVYQLDVNGTARFTGLITASGGISGNIETATRATQANQLIAGTATAASFQNSVWYPSADSVSRMNFTTSGTTIFGTATNYEFRASDYSAVLMNVASNTGEGNGILTTGVVRTANGSATTPSHSFTSLTNAGLYTNGTGIGLATGGIRAIYVNSSQRVGIATDSPAYTLDVNGTFNTTTLYVNGQQFVPGALGTTVSTSNILTSTMTTSTLTTTTTAYLTNTATQQLWVTTGSINAVINFFSSTDGRTWSSTRTGITQTNNGSVGNAVAYNGSIWVIGGSTGSSSILYTSSNGTAWGINPTTLNQTNCFGLAWNGTYWLILGAATTAINTIIKANATLTSYTTSASGGASGFATQANAAAWNGSMWVAVGVDSGANANMKYSYDGTNWTNAAAGRIAGGGNAVIWNGYIWVAGGTAGGSSVLWYSYNGINWTASPNGTTLMTSSCQSIAWNGTVFVAAGYSGGAGRLIYSYDGITWTAVSGYVLSVSVFSVVWNGKLFVAAGSGTVGTTSSPDGITWTAQSSGPGSSDNMYAVGFSSNVTPDAVIGTVAFQSKQPQFLFSTPTINAGSNWLTLNGSMKVTPTSVGINTGNPLFTLDVNGSINTNATLTCSSSPSGSGYLRMLATGNGTFIQSGVNSTTGSTAPLYITTMNAANTICQFAYAPPANGVSHGTHSFYCPNSTVPTIWTHYYSGGADGATNGGLNANHYQLYVYPNGAPTGVWDINSNGNMLLHGYTTAYGGIGSGTFNVGSRINFPNQGVLYGSNTTGTQETCLIPRWSDNRTYLDYGSAGFYIRSNGGPVAMFMATNRNIGIKTDNPEYPLDVNGTMRAASFALGSPDSDRINNAPSYGMGIANYDILGIGVNYHLQIAHYYGISFTCGSTGWAAANPTCVMGNNKVGINTKTPAYALDVTGTIRATADIIAYSDGRYKTNVITLSNALERVNQMRGIYYTMKDKPEDRKVGVIAQEMEAVLPEVVMTDDSEDKKKSVAYGNLTAILIEAVKELTARLERIEQKLNLTVE